VVGRLLRDDIALKIDADSHGLTILVSLAAPDTASSLTDRFLPLADAQK
jgi:hypothetical protein